MSREVKVDDAKCIYCGSCVGVCPVMALRLENDKIKWDGSKCIFCGTCERICPADAIRITDGSGSSEEQ